MPTPLERLRRRYETSDTKCPECGFVDEDSSWKSHTDGSQIVYQYACPSCDASRDHTFRLG